MNADNSKLFLPTDPFEGSFRELLGLVKEHPALVESAKARLHRLIYREGVQEVRSAAIQRIYQKDALVAYNAFSNFHGIEPAIHTVVTDYLGAAVMGAEPDKQAMVLIGPPGSGKSDYVTRIKQLYRTSEPIPFNGNCPVHDNPLGALYMIPRIARERSKGRTAEGRRIQAQLLESLGVADLLNWNAGDVRTILARTGASSDIEGLVTLSPEDLVSVICYGLGLPRSTRNNVGKPCPYCQDLLLGKYQNPGQPVDLAEFPIESMFFDMDDEGSGGIVDVPEVQPLNFDIGTWIGTENLGLMGRVDPKDPRSVQLNGAFNKGIRGLVILTEGLKNPPEAQRVLLEALQGRRIGIPAPLGGSLHFDGLVILHSNEGEYLKFIGDRVNEPYVDRFWRIWFPYPLETSEIAKVTRKLWTGSDFAKSKAEGGVHLEPIVPEYEAVLRALTYIENDASVPNLVKVSAYDGRDIRQKGMGTKLSVADLRQRASTREGLEGISPRETAKVINAIAAEMKGRGDCVTSKALRDRLHEWFRINISDDAKLKKYQGFLSNELDEWRRKRLQRIVLSALIEGFKDESQSTFERYLDNIGAYVRNQSVRSSGGYSRGPVGGDETFMREIESDPDWGVTSAEAAKFRAEVLGAVTQYMTENKATKVPYSCHDAVKNCIERYVLRKVKDTARLFSSSSARDEQDRRKLTDAKDRLVRDHGFCEHCAEELLREAEETRDFLVEK